MGSTVSRIFASTIAVLCMTTSLVSTAVAMDDIQKKELGAFIKQYLIENPEILAEAQAALEKKQAAQQAEKSAQIVETNKDAIFQSKNDVVLGNPNGKVSIVEFFDYNCHYCKQALADMDAIIEKDKDVRFVLKEFPILGPESVAAHRVADAFRLIAPEKYSDYHHKLLGGTDRATEETAIAVGVSLGVSEAELRAKMEESPSKPRVKQVYALANQLGISGTPSYIVGNESVSGAIGIDLLSEKVTNVRSCGKTIC